MSLCDLDTLCNPFASGELLLTPYLGKIEKAKIVEWVTKRNNPQRSRVIYIAGQFALEGKNKVAAQDNQENSWRSTEDDVRTEKTGEAGRATEVLLHRAPVHDSKGDYAAYKPYVQVYRRFCDDFRSKSPEEEQWTEQPRIDWKIPAKCPNLPMVFE